MLQWRANQAKAKTLGWASIFHKKGQEPEEPVLCKKEEKEDTENWPSLDMDHTLR